MITINSSKLKDGDNKEKFSYVFVGETNNTGVKEIVEPLLKDIDCARVRARAEIIDDGLSKKYITFYTYRTDLELGESVRVNGLSYKITQINLSFKKDSALFKVSGVRYE